MSHLAFVIMIQSSCRINTPNAAVERGPMCRRPMLAAILRREGGLLKLL
jgi:hypothetical protein